MLLIVLVYSLALHVSGQHEDDRIDPYDMLNYDPSTKTMRRPAEPTNYPNVPTERRQYNEDSNEAEQMQCNTKVKDLQSQVDQLKKKISHVSQQPTCNPVFKRFLSRLLKEIQRVGLPSDSADVSYDAKIKLSSQAMAEIQNLLEGEDSWGTGALDNAISQVLVDLRPHDFEARKWPIEDTYGVDLDTLLKMGLFLLVLLGIICTQLWSTVSWFIQFRRMLFVGFIVSIFWNWLYLYKIEFAKHQSNLMKVNADYEKCTGIKTVDWRDSLREWYRSTWTLQDDPCKKYYEVLMVDPLLLVPPSKAFSVTVTTFFTEPLKHIGEGISEFIQALLKDLPVTLQIPVFLTIVLSILLSIVIFTYGSVNAAFRYGITAPFRRPPRDPPPLQPRPRRHDHEIEDSDHGAGGDTPQLALRYRVNDGRVHRNKVNQRRPNRPMEQRARVAVETLHTAGPTDSEDEIDAGVLEEEQNLSAESDPETQQDVPEDVVGASANTDSTIESDSNIKPNESEPSQSKSQPLKVTKKLSRDESSRENTAPRPQPDERRPPQIDVQDQPAAHVETVGVPVQESSPVAE